MAVALAWDFDVHTVGIRPVGTGPRVFNESLEIRPWKGVGRLDIRGDENAPDQVAIRSTDRNAVNTRGALPGMGVTVRHLTLAAPNNRALSHGGGGKLRFGDLYFEDSNVMFGPEGPNADMETCGPLHIRGSATNLADVDCGWLLVVHPVIFERDCTFDEQWKVRHGGRCRVSKVGMVRAAEGVTVTNTRRALRVVQRSMMATDGRGNPGYFPGGGGVSVDPASSFDHRGAGVYV